MNPVECIPLYDFEAAIESAVKSVLTTAELKAFTSFDSPDLQRERPRVEIEFQTGPATGHRSLATEVYRPDAFTGNCSLVILTNTSDAENSEETPSNAGTRAHAQYRAVVRYLMAGIETTLTDDSGAANTLLPYHSVNRFIENGTSPAIKNEEGYIASQLNYEVHFNIRPAVWPA